MKNRLFSKIILYLRLMRVADWIKNLFIFVPWLFAKQMFNAGGTIKVLTAFFSFCLISSFVYVVNDRFDAESDRQHPVKKFRPIASGEIAAGSADIFMIILFICSIAIACFLDIKFIMILLAYAVLNFFYSVKLKDIVIVDIFTIAAGFILRIGAGAVAIDVIISKWLLLTTLFISLFLAVMKRRSELMLVKGGGSSRKVLADYNLETIDQISMVASSGVIICYALYTVAEQTISKFGTERLIYTTIFVVFGMFRYIYLSHKIHNTENVAEVIIKDKPMLINLLLYIIAVTLIIYFS
jgi:4-hydroxybenzoate polyprenyltransferase